MRETILRSWKRLVAAATLVAVAGALAPAVAAPVDRHCAAGGGHEIAVSVAPATGCHQAATAPCAAGGCLVAPAALVPATVIAPRVPATLAVVSLAAVDVPQRLTLGPPTPPPNS